MKGKTILIALALVAILGGSLILYNALKDDTRPDPLGTIPAPETARPASASEDTLPPAQPETANPADTPPSDEAASLPDEKGDSMKAPDFTVQDAEGNAVKLSDMLGKPVIVNFWASWCPPCKAEMPEFNKVFEELGGDVQFMMIDAVDGERETKKIGQAYVDKQGYTFPVYYDIEQDAVIQYGIRAFPTSIFIDSEGYVAAGVEGMIDEATLRKGIDLIR